MKDLSKGETLEPGGPGAAAARSRLPLPLSTMFGRLDLSQRRPVADVIAHVEVRRDVLQDFRPLVESLEWELSEFSWGSEGVLQFAGNSVPFVINNTGRASEDAAIVLFGNCEEVGANHGDIEVLELGAGSGLFARYLLDAFQALCQQENRDYYDRLTVFVSDRSERTVRQWNERGLFESHAGRVRTGTSDATDPRRFRELDGEVLDLAGLRAIFANYTLDVLPAAIVRNGNTAPEQLCVRTHLVGQRELLPQYTDLTAEEVRRLARSSDPAARARLVPLLTLLEFEADFRAIDGATLPYLEPALEFGKDLERITLCYGALECIERSLEILQDDGFVLVNDYGPVKRDEVVSHSSTQRFGPTTALGVNFPLLEHHLSQSGFLITASDGDEDRPIHSRLIAKRELTKTEEAFGQRFSAAAMFYFERDVEEAAKRAAAGQLDAALESYRAALAKSPRDWYLIGRTAEFVAFELRDFQSALDLVQAALELNPWYSAWLWNILGDCVYCLERFQDAHEAYLQAQRVDPDDVRTNFNLSYTYAQLGDYTDAFAAIAHGLARDAQGAFTEQLLEKQRQLIASFSGRYAGEQVRLARRAKALGSFSEGDGPIAASTSSNSDRPE